MVRTGVQAALGKVMALSITPIHAQSPNCIDLDARAGYKHVFDFATCRRPEWQDPSAGFPEGADA